MTDRLRPRASNAGPRLPWPAIMLVVCSLPLAVFGTPGKAAGADSSHVVAATPLEGFANNAFRAAWRRDDGDVARASPRRAWLWGPGPIKTAFEPDSSLPSGARFVEYFDYGRMEVAGEAYQATNPGTVSGGSLVSEMVTGTIYNGGQGYVLGPAKIPVFEELGPDGPYYSSFTGLTGHSSDRTGQVVADRLPGNGNTPLSSSVQVRLGRYEVATGHNWAEPLWKYANSASRPADFSWIRVLGYPVTEPYLVTNRDGRDAVMQLFERRALIFWREDSAGDQVRWSMAGTHYLAWRYADRHEADLQSRYKVMISVGPAPGRNTSVSEQVQVINSTPNALRTIVLHAPWAHWDGVFFLANAAVDGSPAPTKWQMGINLSVTLPAPLPPGARTDVALDFSLKPRPVGGRTGYDRSNDILTLGDMLPTVVPWDNGGWAVYPYSDLGDLGYYAVADYDVRIAALGTERLVVAGTGELLDVTGSREHHFVATQVRDVAYVISPRFVDPRHDAGLTRRLNQSTVYAYFLPQHRAQAVRQLDLVSGAMGWFSAHVGPYPKASFTIAEMGVPLERTDNYAQEYPGAYFIPSGWLAYDTTPGRWTWYTPFHEAGHQWFYSTVGNNQLQDPWLDEALTSYMTAEYIRDSFPELYASSWRAISGAAPTGRPVSSSVFSGFLSEAQYTAAVYDGGVRMLDEVRRAMGDSAFRDAVRDYFAQLQNKRSDTRKLISIFSRHTHAALADIFANYAR